MAHFAKVRNSDGVVVETVVVANEAMVDGSGNEQESLGVAFLENMYGEDSDHSWKQTSYNGTFRKNFASVGDVYDTLNNWFRGVQPYASWTLNSSTAQWEAPIARPNTWNGGQTVSNDDLNDEAKPDVYFWDESAYQADNTKGWTIIDNPE